MSQHARAHRPDAHSPPSVLLLSFASFAANTHEASAKRTHNVTRNLAMGTCQQGGTHAGHTVRLWCPPCGKYRAGGCAPTRGHAHGEKHRGRPCACHDKAWRPVPTPSTGHTTREARGRTWRVDGSSGGFSAASLIVPIVTLGKLHNRRRDRAHSHQQPSHDRLFLSYTRAHHPLHGAISPM